MGLPQPASHPHLRGLCLAGCAALALAAPARAAQDLRRPMAEPPGPQDVFGALDLSSWYRLGRMGVDTDFGPANALFEGRRQAAAAAGPARVTLTFAGPQVIRSVTLQSAGVIAAVVRLVVDDEAAPDQQVDLRTGETVSFDLPDVTCRRLRLEFTPSARAGPMRLLRMGVTGRMAIHSLALPGVPESLPVGGSFPLRIIGTDAFGGHPDLTDQARLQVSPARALARTGTRQLTARAAGPVQLVPRSGSLRGPPVSMLVLPLQRAPAAPAVRGGVRVVDLSLDGEPPHEIFRRRAGAREEQTLGRTVTRLFVDDGVDPGLAYHYSSRRTDRFGNALTGRSGETRVRTLGRPPPGHASPGRFPVLAALFVDSLDEGEAVAIGASLQQARQFIYRHSDGRCVLDLTLLPVSGATPMTLGPTMVGIEDRLRELGLTDDTFGLVVAVAGDLAGDFGGFTLLGSAAGAMIRGTAVPTPTGAMGPRPGLAYSFVHELQHLFGQMLASEPDQPSGHFAEDWAMGRLGTRSGLPLDTGEAWAGQAALLARFGSWARIGRPWRRGLETIDSDGDGLPDDDPRLPLDEHRFGSDPRQADTDGDGLSDLEEAAAGLYGGSDPRDPDSDGDGLPDGADPWPLDVFTGVIPRAARPVLLARRDHGGDPITLGACWDETTLTLEVTTAQAHDVFVDLDGSGALGRWETDVNTGTPETPASDVWCGPARLALRAHGEPVGLFRGTVPVPGARVQCTEDGSGHRLRAVLPRELGPGAADVYVPPGARTVRGLRLRPGTVLGLAVTLRPARSPDPEPFEAFGPEGWISLFETHRLLDAVLAAPPPAAR